MPHSKSARMVRNSVGSSSVTNRNQGGGSRKGGSAPSATGFNSLPYKLNYGIGNKNLVFNFQSSHSSTNLGKRGQRNKCCNGQRQQLKMMPNTNTTQDTSCRVDPPDCSNCTGTLQCCNNGTCSADSRENCQESNQHWCGTEPTCKTSMDCVSQMDPITNTTACCINGSCSFGDTCKNKEDNIVLDYSNGFEFPRWDNPIQAPVSSNKANNYMLVIGDWGAIGSPNPNSANDYSQHQVAKAMWDYVSNQPTEKNLVAVLNVGDNFYWQGVGNTDSEAVQTFKNGWENIYGNNKNNDITDNKLISVPWISVGGNHDWGSNDNYALCPNLGTVADENTLPLYWSDKTLRSPTNQIYYTRQLNKCSSVNSTNSTNSTNSDCAGCHGGKGGSRSETDIRCKDKRKNGVSCYYMPDFSYYYRIDELNLIIIVIDANYVDAAGTGGDNSGYPCGGGDESKAIFTPQLHNILNKTMDTNSGVIADSLTDNNPIPQNVVIVNHYGDNFWNDSGYVDNKPIAAYKDIFTTHHPQKTLPNIISVYGHTHRTEDPSYTNVGNITILDNETTESTQWDWLAGGGGGCCDGSCNDGNCGFGVIIFDSNGNMSPQTHAVNV